MLAKPRSLDAEIEALEEAVDLEARFGRWTPEALVELSIRRFAGGVAAVAAADAHGHGAGFGGQRGRHLLVHPGGPPADEHNYFSAVN